MIKYFLNCSLKIAQWNKAFYRSEQYKEVRNEEQSIYNICEHRSDATDEVMWSLCEKRKEICLTFKDKQFRQEFKW